MYNLDNYKNYIKALLNNEYLINELDCIEEQYPGRRRTKKEREYKGKLQENAFIRYCAGLKSNHHDWDIQHVHDLKRGDLYSILFDQEIDLKCSYGHFPDISDKSYTEFNGDYFWLYNGKLQALLVIEKDYIHTKIDISILKRVRDNFITEEAYLPFIDGEHIFIVKADK